MSVQLLERRIEDFNFGDAEVISFNGTASVAKPRIQARNTATACEGCNAHKRTICADLRNSELEEFAGQSRTRLVKAGEALYHEGDNTEYLFTVVAGEVRLVNLLDDGRRQVSAFKTAGDLLGDQQGGRYLYSAEAVSDVIVCQMPLQALEIYLDKMPSVRKALLAKMQEEMNELRNHVMVLGRKTPIEKIASFLVNRVQKLDMPEDETVQIGLAMGRSDIADFLGLTIETVSRTITRLKNLGILAVPSAHTIEIRDMGELVQLADGEK